MNDRLVRELAYIIFLIPIGIACIFVWLGLGEFLQNYSYQSKDSLYEALVNGWIKIIIGGGILYFFYDAWQLRVKEDE